MVKGVKQFLHLVVNERFQLQAAATWGEVPSLRRALEKVKNQEVLQVYHDTFAVADMVVRVRPSSRQVNDVLEKYLKEALYGQRNPDGALQGVLQELKQLTPAR